MSVADVAAAPAETSSETSNGSLRELKLAFTFALREMRAGVRGFYVFLGCLALGVAAIAGVNSLSASLVDGIAAEGKTILGGDVRFSLIHRQATEAERDFLNNQGLVAELAEMRAMARLPDGSQQSLAEVKGVDGAYPLVGEVSLRGGGPLDDALAKNGNSWGGVAEAELLARLDIEVGDTIELGEVAITISDVIAREPDRLSGGVGFGPRLLVSAEALQQSQLVRPGSLVRWHYNIVTNKDIADIRADAEEAHPDSGWRIRGRDNASPGLSSNINRFAQFLTLVGLTALIVGGVGVANSVQAYLETKRQVIATFKSVGASGRFVFAVYMMQILMLAGLAAIIGIVVGAFVPLLASLALTNVLPITIDTSIKPLALALASLYGFLMAITFALWPLSKARDVPATALFRQFDGRTKRWPKPVYLVTLAVSLALLVALAVGLSDNQELAIVFIAGAVVSFLILRLVALFIMAVARRLPHAKSTALRLAVGNVHRPGALTPSIVLSLGLGLTLLVAVALIDFNLRNQLTGALADQAPSFFFVDIQNSEIDSFEKKLDAEAPNAFIQRVPMLRGSLLEIKGVPPSQANIPSRSQWAARGDRGITYSATLPENSKLVQGEWWPEDYSGEPLVSLDEEVGLDFGLKIGDKIKVNVLGRPIEAKVANFRSVQWESLAINFVMVFSPNTFAGAPHAHLATLTYPEGSDADTEFALLKSVTNAFPAVTSIRVKDALDAVANIVRQLAWAIRGASSVTLVASILVLAGALAAGHRNRLYDAVVLKTLGATRGQLLKAYMLEYILLGVVTAVFAIATGTLASWYVTTFVIEGEFTFSLSTALTVLAIALALTVGLGLVGTWRLLGQKASPILREL